ncbi:MAG: type I-B CRISPR-associated protein Cas5 [Planctomycetes bacterium]|nr:type I-B CRISPR-associated protein Cas5 [Planctomycetota bacterium]
MTRNFVVFEVAGDMAHFRRPYAITTALTFPAPPRTALCGLIGAILGLPKNESLASFRDDQAIFGLQLVEPLRTGHVSLNLLQTKGSTSSFRPKAINPHTTMRYEIIRTPKYRLFFSHAELGERLFEHLVGGQSCYTPCLGLAWMIAWFGNSVRTVKAEEVQGDGKHQEFVSPVRTGDVQDIRWDEDAVYQRIRMPAEMLPSRKVERYEEYLLETSGKAISAALTTFWRCEDGTCFSAM